MNRRRAHNSVYKAITGRDVEGVLFGLLLCGVDDLERNEIPDWYFKVTDELARLERSRLQYTDGAELRAARRQISALQAELVEARRAAGAGGDRGAGGAGGPPAAVLKLMGGDEG